MHPPRSLRPSLAVLLPFALACAGPAEAADAVTEPGGTPEVRLRMQPSFIRIPADNKDEVPVFVEADNVRGYAAREVEAEGSVRLRRRDQHIFADWMRYDQTDDEATAEGNVRFERFGDWFTGKKLRANLQDERGFMTDTEFQLRPDPPKAPRTRPVSAYQALPVAPATFARGTAERIEFESRDRMRTEQTTFTTCECGNDAWVIKAGELTLDQDKNVGVARDAKIEFYGVPIMYTPYLSFPLKEERKSGFLSPIIGTTGKTGVQVALPYYWNIAPNYDATFTPRYLQKNGPMLDTEFRYLEKSLNGRAFYEVLPNDRANNDKYRYYTAFRHQQNYGPWYGMVNFEQVSDSKYFTDLSTNVGQTSQAVLPREATIGRNGTWLNGGVWNMNALYQRWQTLQVDLTQPVTPPYSRAPQVTLTASKADLAGFDFDLISNYNQFDNPLVVKPNGQRWMAYPSISMPFTNSYGYVTPKVGVNYRQYSIDNKGLFPDFKQSITTPIVSLDSGLVFERDQQVFGTAMTQTLEPRVYYTYIPYRDQTRIPSFESTLQDLSFATLFTENQFSGYDRINDLNAVTWGVSSRLIDSASGVERIGVAVAQRYFFERQQVTLPGSPPTSSNTSDLLAAIRGTIVPGVSVDAGIGYAAQQSQTQRAYGAVRYNPEPGKLVNVAYRYVRQNLTPGQGSTDQVDVSGQWRLGTNWGVVGRYNYAFNDSRALEALAGLEYNDGCWAIRGLFHRFATTTSQEVTSFFVQLELSGISKVGLTAEQLLRRSVPGYAATMPRAPSDVDPFSNYR
jgi:LPS-assembly protein